MPPSLSVDLNRGRLHDIEVPTEFEAGGTFDVVLNNHGEAVHVHLHLDDDLSAVASLADGNHYVEREGEVVVPVRVDAATDEEATTGRLKVVTGYGAEQRFVSVTVEPEREKPAVEVDESLSRPGGTERNSQKQRRDVTAAVGDVSFPVLVVGIVVVLLALVVGVVFESSLLLVAAGVALGAMGAVAVMSRRTGRE